MSEVFIHPTAIVATEQIGQGTRIWAFTHVMKDVSIGANCNVGSHCFIESGVVVGRNVTIKNGNMIWDGVTLEDGVFVGPNVSFTNDLHPRSPRIPQAEDRYTTRGWLLPTLVRECASLGAAAVILAGTTIGEFSMVGAGAVVTKGVPAYAVVVGCPAHMVGWVCQCGQRLRFQEGLAVCTECGLRFLKQGASIRLRNPHGSSE